jgi:hypothetical protein
MPLAGFAKARVGRAELKAAGQGLLELTLLVNATRRAEVISVADAVAGA